MVCTCCEQQKQSVRCVESPSIAAAVAAAAAAVSVEPTVDDDLLQSLHGRVTELHDVSTAACHSTVQCEFSLLPASPCQGAPWSWKVMEFRKTIFQTWKVMENDDNVMEFLLLH